MMFRNQTSFAAQKAEDSWRKRTKSRKQAIGESKSSHQLSAEDQNAIQIAASSSTTDETLGTMTKETKLGPLPPMVDFNDLSIGPRIGTNLRRLAYERYVYDFVVFETPNRPPGTLTDAVYDFIPALYQRALDGSCLVAIVDAVSYANFANRRNAPEAQALGEQCLGRAIKLLQAAITDKDQAGTDEVLCSVYLMGVYGVRLSS